jgi:hypothetical protein
MTRFSRSPSAGCIAERSTDLGDHLDLANDRVIELLKLLCRHPEFPVRFPAGFLEWIAVSDTRSHIKPGDEPAPLAGTFQSRAIFAV